MLFFCVGSEECGRVFCSGVLRPMAFAKVLARRVSERVSELSIRR
jgi:hypothetical protein